jgi:hypothetical protein
MAQATRTARPVVNISLEDLTARLAELVRPVIARNLRTGPNAALAASTMVHDAARVRQSLSKGDVRVTREDEHAVVALLAPHLSEAERNAAPQVMEHHVREAADAMAATWVDVLDQGCEKHGVLELHPELLIPTAHKYPELVEILEESLLPTLLSDHDAHEVMHGLRQQLYAQADQVVLPLGIRLSHSSGGTARAERGPR